MPTPDDRQANPYATPTAGSTGDRPQFGQPPRGYSQGQVPQYGAPQQPFGQQAPYGQQQWQGQQPFPPQQPYGQAPYGAQPGMSGHAPYGAPQQGVSTGRKIGGVVLIALGSLWTLVALGAAFTSSAPANSTGAYQTGFVIGKIIAIAIGVAVILAGVMLMRRRRR